MEQVRQAIAQRKAIVVAKQLGLIGLGDLNVVTSPTSMKKEPLRKLPPQPYR